jgi:hypothetical protein
MGPPRVRLPNDGLAFEAAATAALKKKAAADADMLGRLDLTHQRHWLRTAAMVLMLISVFINLLV